MLLRKKACCSLGCADRDEIDRNALVELELEHALHYQIRYLIGIVDVYGSDHMRHIRVVLARCYHHAP